MSGKNTIFCDELFFTNENNHQLQLKEKEEYFRFFNKPDYQLLLCFLIMTEGGKSKFYFFPERPILFCGAHQILKPGEI